MKNLLAQPSGIMAYIVFILLMALSASCAKNVSNKIQVMGLERGMHWEEECLSQNEDWYGSEEAQRIADNMLYFQNDNGGWPKNVNMTEQLNVQDKIKRMVSADLSRSTIDNLATFTQMRFLANVYHRTNNEQYATSFNKGLDYLLEAQYENGGWPQFYPLRKGYYSHITFNDEAMVGVLFLLRDILNKPDDFPAIDENQNKKVEAAVEKGIECILKCQIRTDGKLTAWCAQHDVNTLAAVKARSYELPSLSGKESAGIVEFLMSINNPDERIIQSIQSAVKWFDEVRVEGIRQKWVSDKSVEGGYDKRIIKDPGAPSIWGRFYEIGSNQYFFCDRDGSVHYDMVELSSERRIKYGWVGYWPKNMMEKFYPKWQKKWAPGQNVLKRNK